MIRTRLETLPDEIFMLIFQYFEDVYLLFRIFLGLNRRLNRILVDKRLHLFTNFLQINGNDPNFDRYYDSTVFRTVTQRLVDAKPPRKQLVLEQCFRSLIVFHLREQYHQMKAQIELQIGRFQTIRESLLEEDAARSDQELKKTFEDLQKPLGQSTSERMASLVHTKGARLEYNEHEQAGFYFAEDFHDLFSSRNEHFRPCSPMITSRMLQTLFISNPSLLQYPYYGGGYRFSIYEYLCYSIYRLQSYGSNRAHRQSYHALTELILFATQCQRCSSNDRTWLQKTILIILDALSKTRRVKSSDIVVRTTQLEILTILLDEYRTERADGDCTHRFKQTLDSLVAMDRWDVISLLYRCPRLFQDFFHDTRTIVHVMTENQLRRRLLYRFIDEQPRESWLITGALAFTLLEKKQSELIEKLLQASPDYIHQLDREGNTLLLFLCLRVSGRRHRIAEQLIRLGCDPGKRNFRQVSFGEALRVPRNRWLLHHLIKRRSIQVDEATGQMTVTTNREMQKASLSFN